MVAELTVQNDDEVLLMDFEQTKLDLLPVTPQTAMDMYQQYKSNVLSQSIALWWLKSDNHFKLTHPNLSWNEYCSQFLKCSRTHADHCYLFVEVNRDLPPKLQVRKERHARALNAVPREHRAQVMAEAWSTLEPNFKGFKVMSAGHIEGTWRKLFPVECVAIMSGPTDEYTTEIDDEEVVERYDNSFAPSPRSLSSPTVSPRTGVRTLTGGPRDANITKCLTGFKGIYDNVKQYKGRMPDELYYMIESVCLSRLADLS